METEQSSKTNTASRIKENDEIIERYHADRLFDAAKEPKLFKLIDGGHNNALVTKDNRQVLFDYLKTLRK